jgi:hypothetical protein
VPSGMHSAAFKSASILTILTILTIIPHSVKLLSIHKTMENNCSQCGSIEYYCFLGHLEV